MAYKSVAIGLKCICRRYFMPSNFLTQIHSTIISLFYLYTKTNIHKHKKGPFLCILYIHIECMYIYIPTDRDKIRVKHLLLQQHECFDAIGCCSSYPTMLHVNKKKIIWHSKRIYDAYAL